MTDKNDILDTLYKATAAIKALQPEPQFAVVHPDDFLNLKEQLESQGMEVTQYTDSSIWNCVMVQSGFTSGVLIKIAVSEEAPRGKALTMPLPKFDTYAISPYNE